VAKGVWDSKKSIFRDSHARHLRIVGIPNDSNASGKMHKVWGCVVIAINPTCVVVLVGKSAWAKRVTPMTSVPVAIL
jgi:hypothetical protein